MNFFNPFKPHVAQLRNDAFTVRIFSLERMQYLEIYSTSYECSVTRRFFPTLGHYDLANARNELKKIVDIFAYENKPVSKYVPTQE